MNGLLTADRSPAESLHIQEARSGGRFHVWGEMVATACGPMRVHQADRGAFDGVIVSGTFGSVQVATVRADPHTVELTEGLATRAKATPLHLTCVLDGEVVIDQGGTHAVAGTDSLFCYDGSCPFVLRMSAPIHMVTVKFDHRLVDLRVGLEHPLRAATWSGREGAGGLLASLLRSLTGHMRELDAVAAGYLGSSLASLVTAVCAEKLRYGGEGAAAARRAQLHRIKSYARARLGDPGITPPLLAEVHHVSLRYLQLLFQDEGTSPAQWIRNERLAGCREDLGNPRMAHLTVAHIGERWGLHGASHFSKLFRQRYGITPREWRQRSLSAGSAGSAGSGDF